MRKNRTKTESPERAANKFVPYYFIVTFDILKLKIMIFAALGAYILFILSIAVLAVIASWKIYTKAGQPGWASIVPIYNLIILLEIVRKPWWWLLMMMIPLVNIYFLVVMMDRLAKSFGKNSGFTVGLIFLGPIFYLILAFDGSPYTPLDDQR